MTDTGITYEQIQALQIDAGARGDAELVYTCQRAMQGSKKARAECARVIAQKRDNGHFLSTDFSECLWCGRLAADHDLICRVGKAIKGPPKDE